MISRVMPKFGLKINRTFLKFGPENELLSSKPAAVTSMLLFTTQVFTVTVPLLHHISTFHNQTTNTKDSVSG